MKNYEPIFKYEDNPYYGNIFQDPKETERLNHDGTLPHRHLCPVTLYFKKGASFPRRIREYLQYEYKFSYNCDIEKYREEINKLPNKIIDLKLIIPTQPNLEKHKVLKEKVPQETVKAYFLLMNGYYYLLDGHHRVASMILNNQPIKGKVIDPKLSKNPISMY